MRLIPLGIALAAAVACGPALAHDHGKVPPKAYTGTAASPTDPREREVAVLFDRWNAALATGNPRTVVALYAPNGILQPTVSNEVRVGPEAIERYFVDFLKLKPRGTINFREIRVLDADTALDSGVYTFALDRDGATQHMQARYTYIYEKVGGEWKIANHHSSAMPEPVAATAAR